MTAILYPVAKDGRAALSAALGRAAREREAAALAGAAVSFVSEAVGPAFETPEAARAAYAEWLDGAAEDRICTLREVVQGAEGRWPALPPVEPSFAEGRRWPEASGGRLPTAWRVSVSYWRIAGAEEIADQARAVRRDRRAAAMEAKDLRAIARAPLRPVAPQQPLDFGLFEAPLPEAPDSFIPDE